MADERWDWSRVDLGETYSSGGDSEDADTAWGPEAVRPPAGLLGVVAATVAASGLLLLATSVGTHIVGYVLAGLVSITLVAIFKKVDQGRRQSGFYSPSRVVERAVPVTAVAAVVVAGLHAWFLAQTWAA